VKRLAVATLVVTIASVAHADTPAPGKPSEPDEIADVEGREANLESREPRKGLTFAVAIAPLGITLGGAGVGRGPSISLRLGHVATRKTVITFELATASALHKRATMDDTVSDNTIGFFVGAQRYTSGSFWLRIAGGPAALVKNANTNGSGGDPPIAGLGGLLGGGLDIARWGYLVLGLEATTLTSLSRDGFKMNLAIGLGLSYY
jgi:hypothetical protein